MKCNHVPYLGKYPVTCRLCREGSMSDDWKERFRNKFVKYDPSPIANEILISGIYLTDIEEFIQLEIRKAKEECEKKSDIILTQVMEERDYAEDMADQLAYKIAPEEIIGEHTSANNPWQNALDYEESDSLK